MKLDPAKADFSELAAALNRLESLRPQRAFQPETAKTLKDGRLEDWDLFELVVREYEAELDGREDVRPVWDLSRALLSVIAEMEAVGLRSDSVDDVRKTLLSWKLG